MNKYSVKIEMPHIGGAIVGLFDTIPDAINYVDDAVTHIDEKRVAIITSQLNAGKTVDLTFGKYHVIMYRFDLAASSAVFDKDEAEYEDHYFKTWTNHGARIDASN